MQAPRSTLGAYYTTPQTAAWLARWALAGGASSVLEPSFGEGVFLRALHAAASQPLELHGVELDPATHGAAVAAGLLPAGRARCADFLDVAPFSVDAVLGNPPYVRLRHLPPERARTAREVAGQALAMPMQSSGSVWMPFVLHAQRFLRPGGRMGFVLPFELTHVRYARPLWRWLADRFARLRLIRVRERIFPEILQQVVLLLCEESGGRTETVELQTFERVADLMAERPLARGEVQIERLAQGHRDLLRAHLSAPAQALWAQLEPRLVPVRESCRFHIGYVTGHKRFFHPSPAQIAAHQLPPSALRPALTSSRSLRGRGLFTADLPDAALDRLFLPDPQHLSPAEQAYLRRGEAEGVHQRYKCRVRDPWYRVPDVRIPDLVLSVFSERPILLCNDGRLVVTNSLLAGFLGPGQDPGGFLVRWYTPLTRLSCEMEVHALGGGVMVLVPREVGEIRLLGAAPVEPGELERIDAALRAGRVEEAYRSGEGRLERTLGLSALERSRLEDAAEELGRWRTGEAGPKGAMRG